MTAVGTAQRNSSFVHHVAAFQWVLAEPKTTKSHEVERGIAVLVRGFQQRRLRSIEFASGVQQRQNFRSKDVFDIQLESLPRISPTPGRGLPNGP